jgi:hypothetical protein
VHTADKSSGDVHLAAIGQFYSNPKLGIPKDRDYRYMPNVISSAIVNTPPPEMMADVLNKRNKIHHLDHSTDEDMIPIFTHDVNGQPRNNKRLLPRRNWCSIRVYQPGGTPPPTPPDSGNSSPIQNGLMRRLSGRGPSYRPDAVPRNRGLPGERSNAPPLSHRNRERMDEGPGRLSRSLSRTRARSRSLTREIIPALFRRRPHKSDSGGINGYGAESETEEEFVAETPEPYSPVQRPGGFHRTPTGLSEKQRRKQGGGEINLEQGLEIKLNVEVNQKDPAGITVPYTLLVPALRYEEAEEIEKRPTGLTRWISFRKGRSGREKDMNPE